MRSIIHVRISDNVLKADDWGSNEITIVDGRVTTIKEIEPSCYVWRSSIFIGMTVETLLKWFKQDNTGKHPEVYHELKHPQQPRTEWRSPMKMESLKRIIEDAATASDMFGDDELEEYANEQRRKEAKAAVRKVTVEGAH